jgi:hypothetical protein
MYNCHVKGISRRLCRFLCAEEFNCLIISCLAQTLRWRRTFSLLGIENNKYTHLTGGVW